MLSEKISTRIKIRPALEKALTLAHEIKTAAPDQPVILTVHEMKRLAATPPSSCPLRATAATAGVQLALLTKPLTGSTTGTAWAPCSSLCSPSLPPLDRDYIRYKTLEDQHPLVASLYRALADNDT